MSEQPINPTGNYERSPQWPRSKTARQALSSFNFGCKTWVRFIRAHSATTFAPLSTFHRFRAKLVTP